MKTYLVKIIAIITIFSMTIAFAIGSVALTRSTKYLETEIEEKILNTAEKYANDFSAQFNHMEGLTDSLVSYVETTFDLNAFDAAPDRYMEQYKKDLAEIIQSDLHTIKNAHSLYVTFNPNLTLSAHEVWYVMNDGKIEDVSVDYTDKKKEFQLPHKEDMAYFFEPQGKDTGVWIPPYLDKDINEEVFSYSRAIYVDEIFIGVAGADITATDIIEVVEAMKLYNGGYSALLDTDGNMIIKPQQVTAKEQKAITRSLKNIQDGETSGLFQYTDEDQEMILGYSHMDNGWTLVIVQPEAEAYKPMHQLSGIFAILAAVLAVVLICFLYAFSRPFIKKQTSLEKENHEKDLMLMYQSRQAKIGEMVGNITHQWKQPLNTINLIMANLLDSYKYDDLDEARLEKSVQKVDQIIGKMSETITDFSGFLKPTREKASFDVSECIRTAVSLMEESIDQHDIRVVITGQDHENVFGYYNEMVHVIFNILNNARDAIVSSGPPDRSIYIDTAQQGEQIQVTIRNHGSQIPESVLEKVFEPYFTTKEASGGTGLGLFISKQIIEDRMNGNLYIENIEDGVECRIAVPTEEKHEY